MLGAKDALPRGAQLQRHGRPEQQHKTGQGCQAEQGQCIQTVLLQQHTWGDRGQSVEHPTGTLTRHRDTQHPTNTGPSSKEIPNVTGKGKMRGGSSFHGLRVPWFGGSHLEVPRFGCVSVQEFGSPSFLGFPGLGVSWFRGCPTLGMPCFRGCPVSRVPGFGGQGATGRVGQGSFPSLFWSICPHVPPPGHPRTVGTAGTAGLPATHRHALTLPRATVRVPLRVKT